MSKFRSLELTSQLQQNMTPHQRKIATEMCHTLDVLDTECNLRTLVRKLHIRPTLLELIGALLWKHKL